MNPEAHIEPPQPTLDEIEKLLQAPRMSVFLSRRESEGCLQEARRRRQDLLTEPASRESLTRIPLAEFQRDIRSGAGRGDPANTPRNQVSDLSQRRMEFQNLEFTFHLDMSDAITECSMIFENCILLDGLSLANSKVRGVHFINCIILTTGTKAVDLTFCSIDGSLEISSSLIEARDGVALDASGSRLSGDIVIRNSSIFGSDSSVGSCQFVNSTIGGSMKIDESSFVNQSGPAFNASSATIAGDVLFRHPGKAERGDCRILGNSQVGTLQFVTAKVLGQMDFSNAHVHSGSGCAINARGVTVQEDLFIKPGFSASGSGERGVVRLRQAEIGGRLSIVDAHITAFASSQDRSPAVQAADVSTGRSLRIEGCHLTGVGLDGCIRLTGARILGDVRIKDGSLINLTGPLLSANNAAIAGTLAITPTEFKHQGKTGIVRVRDSKSHGLQVRLDLLGISMLDVQRKGRRQAPGPTRSSTDDSPNWLVDGLDLATYPKIQRDAKKESTLNTSDAKAAWAAMLRHNVVEYSAQPYRMLSQLARELGDDAFAKLTLMAQQRDQIEHKRLAGKELWLARLRGSLVGYGYQPWRVMGILAVFMLFGFVLFGAIPEMQLVSGAQESLLSSRRGGACDLTTRLGMTFELTLPPARASSLQSCTINRDLPYGQLLTVASWLLQAVGWASLTLFVAAFTNIVRKAHQ